MGRFLGAVVVAAAIVAGIWVFRYEPVMGGFLHRDRITGRICRVELNC